MRLTDLVDFIFINLIFSLMPWFGGPLQPVNPIWVVNTSFARYEEVCNLTISDVEQEDSRFISIWRKQYRGGF